MRLRSGILNQKKSELKWRTNELSSGPTIETGLIPVERRRSTGISPVEVRQSGGRDRGQKIGIEVEDPMLSSGPTGLIPVERRRSTGISPVEGGK
jgi:hypothetical protein